MTENNPYSWFDSVVPWQRTILLELRALIFEVSPGAVEEIKWSRPCYSNENGRFCYLHTTKSHATLGFDNGTSIQDPENLLEGTGINLRHIKFEAAVGGRKETVRKMLAEAAHMPSPHKRKM